MNKYIQFIEQIKLEVVFIGILTLIAFFLRVNNLGELGFRGDEELTALAIKGLFDHGYPVMPTGMPYLRSLPFSYLVAFSIKIFGENEFAARFPSVIFGVLNIPLIYIFCKKLFNREIAMFVVLLFTFAVWDIQVSRIARMYSMFAFFYLLSLYVFYRGYSDGDRIYIWLTPPLFIFTCIAHTLGIFLVTLFLYPLLVQKYTVVKKRTVVWLFFITGVLDYALMKMINKPYSMQRQMGTEIGTEDVVINQNIWNQLTDLFPQLYLPHQDLVMHLVQFHPYITGILAFFCAFLFAILIMKRYPGFDSRYNLTISVSLLAAVFAQVYGIAAVIILIHLYKKGKGFSALFDREMLTWVGLLLLTFVSWFLYGLFLWQGYGYETTGTIDPIRKIVKSLIYYPPLDLRTFMYGFPKMTILVTVAILVAFHRFASDKSQMKNCFLIYSFVVPLIVSGFLKEWTESRYSFHLYPIFIILFSWIVYEITLKIMKAVSKWLIWITGKPEYLSFLSGKYSIIVSLFVGFMLLSFTVKHNWIRDAYAVSNYTYGDNTIEKLDGSNSYPDHKGAGLFVKKFLKDNDTVIAEDVYQQAYYLGRVDYRIKGWKAPVTSVDKRGLNIYTNSMTIHDLRELLNVLIKAEGKVWIITSNELSPKMRPLYIEPDIDKWLQEREQKVVYTGRDKRTKVYLFVPAKEYVKDHTYVGY